MDYKKQLKPVLIQELMHKDMQITDLKAQLDSANQTKDFLQQQFTEEHTKRKALLEVIDRLTRI